MQPDPTKPPHYSVNGRPLPDAKNVAWPWMAGPLTHYIKMPCGRLFYVRYVRREDIDALTTQEDLAALAVYSAVALQNLSAASSHDGVRKCLNFIARHTCRRIAQLYQSNAPMTRPRDAANVEAA